MHKKNPTGRSNHLPDRGLTQAFPGPLRAGLLCAGILGVALAAGAEQRTLNDAVYSKDQARSGKKIYEAHCLACHERNYFRQVLRTRQGETLTGIFETMVTEMPQNSPGSLSDEEYVDVIAYLLSRARYAAGDEALTASELDSILIPAPG